jgi:hypothetical protein
MHADSNPTLAKLEREGRIDDATAILCEHFLGTGWRSYAVTAALAAVADEGDRPLEAVA